MMILPMIVSRHEEKGFRLEGVPRMPTVGAFLRARLCGFFRENREKEEKRSER